MAVEVRSEHPAARRAETVSGASLIQRSDTAKMQQGAYRPYGTHLELMRYRGREVLIAGPAGTGKSRAALEKLNMVCMQRPVRAAIVRKVRKSLTQAALVTFESKVLPQPSGVRFWTEDQEYRYPGGAVVALAGLDDPEKVKSTEFDIIYVQEATELDQNDWELLVSRLRNGVLSYQQLIADCNPADPYHWLKQRCDRGDCLLLESRHEDNPMLWDHERGEWTEFGTSYLKTLDTLSGYLYQRLRLGLWVAADGMFFTEWNPEVHIVDARDIPSHWPCWTTTDYGFAAPWCTLWLTRDPETRQMYVYRERYATGLRDEEQAEEIRRAEEGDNIVLRVLDPSMFNPRTEQNRPSIAQVYADHGVVGVPGMNNRRTGWAIVRRALALSAESGAANRTGQEIVKRALAAGQAANPAAATTADALPTATPRLRLLRGRAPNLERTLPAMVHDPLDPEDVADKLRGTKTEDHAVDALRYGLAAEAGPEAGPEIVQDVTWG
jgi:phage terminase large subunit